MKPLPTLFLSLFIAGCSDPNFDECGQTKNEGKEVSKFVVAVLGGDTSETFTTGLKAAGVANAQASSSADVAERARLLSSSDVAIVLVDATQGPLPINREDILLSRQFCQGSIIVGFARSATIDDPELLELEELEMRELLNLYGLPGDTATICFDSESALTNLPKGFSHISKILRQLESATKGTPATTSTQQINASLYALADQESFRRGIARPIATGKYRIILGNQVVEAEVQVETTVQPGSSGAVKMRFPENVDIVAGSRFVIGSPDHVLAAGTFTSTKH